MSTAYPLCQFGREKVFNGVLLKKHPVDYFYGDNCGLLQTQEPYWFDEAYTDAIAVADTGLAARNQGIVEAHKGAGQVVAVTASEVLEHVTNPLDFILTDQKINKRQFRPAVRTASWIGYVWSALRMDSLTFPDHRHVCRLDDTPNAP